MNDVKRFYCFSVAEAECGSPQALPLLTQIPLDLEPEPETPPPSVGISVGSVTASPSASSQGDIRYQVFLVRLSLLVLQLQKSALENFYRMFM